MKGNGKTPGPIRRRAVNFQTCPDYRLLMHTFTNFFHLYPPNDPYVRLDQQYRSIPPMVALFRPHFVIRYAEQRARILAEQAASEAALTTGR